MTHANKCNGKKRRKLKKVTSFLKYTRASKSIIYVTRHERKAPNHPVTCFSKKQQVEGFTRMKIASDFVATNWDGTVARVFFAYSSSFAKVSFTVKPTIPCCDWC